MLIPGNCDSEWGIAGQASNGADSGRLTTHIEPLCEILRYPMGHPACILAPLLALRARRTHLLVESRPVCAEVFYLSLRVARPRSSSRYFIPRLVWSKSMSSFATRTAP